jgi:signal recognition particle GTPase
MLFFEKMCQKTVLVGLGGIGKTQVALQLAYWAKDYHHQPQFSVFWV